MEERAGAVTFKGGPLTLLGPELKVGDEAPEAALLAGDLSEAKISDYAGKVRVIITVPSLDTPVCDTETRRFNEATELCEVDLTLLDQILPNFEHLSSPAAGLMTAFRQPAGTAMTLYKIQGLRTRLLNLKLLISPENQGTSEQEKQRLARFAMLNPYSRNYAQELEALMAAMIETGPLLDNVMLARAALIPDLQLRAKTLQEISQTFGGKDGSIQALYELGMLKVQQWKEMKQEGQEKQALLTEARTILTRTLEAHPQSASSEPARRMLASLPQTE